MAKKGVFGVDSDEVDDVLITEFFEFEAAAAAAACKFAMLLCKNSGTPEKARKFEASLSAASWRFHLFLRF